MAKMGLAPIYQKPRTSQPHPQHPIYPYLLQNLAIERPNLVWCAETRINRPSRLARYPLRLHDAAVST